MRDAPARRALLRRLNYPRAAAALGPIAAKFAHPGRPAIAMVGDGAMQMNGINALITVACRRADACGAAPRPGCPCIVRLFTPKAPASHGIALADHGGRQRRETLVISCSTGGRVIYMTIRDPYSDEEGISFLSALSRNPSVPDLALLLLDTRSSSTDFPEIEMGLLGPKLGPCCALVIGGHQAGEAESFGSRVQRGGGPAIRIFQDLAAAYDWIGRYR
jgi:hypothetical protein